MNAVLAPRLARREFLGRLGPTALGLLAACALLPSAAAAQPPAAAQSSGTLTVGMVAEPTSMNPGQQPDQNSERIHSNIFDTLVAYDTQFNLQPSLATSWDVAPDGQTITFHLRDGVKFHDGSAFNAAAVKFTFDRMFQGRDPAFETTGPYPFANAYYGTITSIDAPDNLTAVFHLSRPDSVLLSNLTYTDAAIVSPTAFARLGKDVARNPVGTGPFKFNAWQNGVGVSLDGYPSYWGGAPGVSKLVFRPILEDQARVVELLSGGVNFIVDVPPDNIDQIKSDSGFKFDAQAGPHVWWLTLNVTKAPFDDIRVRQAVNYAVNKTAITNDLLKATASPATNTLPPAIAWAYNSNITGFDYQPDMAKQLLSDAGYAGGVNVAMWVPESGSGMQVPKAMATAIQADLEEVGVHATIQTSEWGAYLKTYQAGMGDTADMAAMSWMVATGDPDILYYPTLHSDSLSPAGFNPGNYKNDQVDSLVQQARTVADRQQRASLYQQVQQLVADDVPWLLVDNAMQTAATAANVQGFQLHPSFLLYFKNTTVT